jgi:exo-beta-1,3-glucanase (GH17 family)
MKSSIIVAITALATHAASAVANRESIAPADHELSSDLTFVDRVHEKFHQERDLPGTVTVTQTVVSPSAVVWVDYNGKIVSTEIKGAPSPPTPAPAPNNAPQPGQFNQVDAQRAGGRPGPGSGGPPGNGNGPQNGGGPGDNHPGNNGGGPVPGLGNGGDPGPAPVGHGTGNGGFGICYDQIGSSGACKTADQVDADFKFLFGQGYRMVRTYDLGCDLGTLIQKASANGMKVFAGINTVSNVAGDIQKLISMVNGNWGPIDTINIGNEQVNHGVAVSVVTAAVTTGREALRAAGYGGNVVTVDVFSQFTGHPELASTSDYLAANAHGFFDSTNTAENDGTWLSNTYATLVAVSNGKKVVITESGWPHAGSSNSNARADPGSQAAAISAIRSAFADKADSLYVFQAYDALYKNPGAMGLEQSFGVYGAGS